MKKIILLLFFIFGIKSSFAECSAFGMDFFPKQQEISLNSMFIIQGYSMSQKTINSFKNRMVFLKSENGKLIELNLLRVLEGQKGLTQAIFKPSKELEPYTTYFLNYSDQTESETQEMMKWNSKNKEREKVFWKTTNKKSFELLDSKLKIEFEKTEYKLYGCGPSANAVFKIKNNTDSEVWYRTEVVELSTNQKTVFLIKEWNGKLNVGHGMCSGAFTYNRKGKYKVRFTPMNIDGKLLEKTNWTTFESPFMNSKNPF